MYMIPELDFKPRQDRWKSSGHLQTCLVPTCKCGIKEFVF